MPQMGHTAVREGTNVQDNESARSYCYVTQMGHTAVKEGTNVQDNESARTTEGLASTNDSHDEYSGMS